MGTEHSSQKDRVGLYRRKGTPCIWQIGKWSYIGAIQELYFWLPRLKPSSHRPVQEQLVYWHLGHAICLKVFCRICYEQLPGGIRWLSRWLCWESSLHSVPWINHTLCKALSSSKCTRSLKKKVNMKGVGWLQTRQRRLWPSTLAPLQARGSFLHFLVSK